VVGATSAMTVMKPSGATTAAAIDHALNAMVDRWRIG